MSVKLIATLQVTFEVEDGHPDWFSQVILRRALEEFCQRIEMGRGVESSGVKRGSTQIKIISRRTETGVSLLATSPRLPLKTL
jgi:hypothetical protein